MVDQERDRYGDKMKEIEKGREEDYFARRDRELIEKMKSRTSGVCPICGTPLSTRGAQMTCPKCTP